MERGSPRNSAYKSIGTPRTSEYKSAKSSPRSTESYLKPHPLDSRSIPYLNPLNINVDNSQSSEPRTPVINLNDEDIFQLHSLENKNLAGKTLPAMPRSPDGKFETLGHPDFEGIAFGKRTRKARKIRNKKSSKKSSKKHLKTRNKRTKR
jgi:hypothetical protein